MENLKREFKGLRSEGFWLYLIIGIVFALLLLIVYYLRSIFIPIFLSFIIAYALNPAVDWIERKKVNRQLAVLFLFFIFTLIIIIAILILIPSLQREVDYLLSELPQYLKSIQETRIPQIEKILGRELPSNFNEFLNQLIIRISNLSFDVIKPLGSLLLQLISNLIDFVIDLLNFILIPLFTFYFMRDFHKLKKSVLGVIPERYRSGFRSKLKEIDIVLNNFIRGQILVCLILAVLYSIGLVIIGIDLAISVGVFSGLAFIIPYVGTILGIILSSLLALLKFGDFRHLLYVWGWFGLVQLLEGYYITPKLIGKKLGIHPMIVIISLLIGGKVMGLLGILIAVPVAAVLKIFINSFLQLYKNSSFFLSY